MMSKKFMKILLSLLFTALVITSLAACGGNIPTTPDSKDDILGGLITTDIPAEAPVTEAPAAETPATDDETIPGKEPSEFSAETEAPATDGTGTRKPGTATATPMPTSTPAATSAPAPATETAAPTEAPKPTEVPKPTATPKPTEAPRTGNVTPAPHTHSYTASVTTEATCEKAGIKTYKCACGASYTESIPAKGHAYYRKVAVAPRCEYVGSNFYTCRNCSAFYSETIPATGHDWQTVIVHHEVRTETFDVYEIEETWYYRYWLTEWGAQNGYGNWPSDPKRYYVPYAKVRYKQNQYVAGNVQGTERLDYEILWKADDDILKEITMRNKECYMTYGHAFIGPTVAGSEYAADTYSLLNWDDRSIQEKKIVVGTKTFTCREAYDEAVATCSVCGKKQ